MALQKYTQTLLGGFNTSNAGATAHMRVAIRINDAIDVFDALNKDTSRTKSEKAPLFKQLQEKHGRAIKADFEAFGKELLQRTENYESQKDKVLKSVSMADAIQSIAGLKMAGVTAEQLRGMVADSPEIAIAMARVPKDLSGWAPEIAEAAALKHFPALVELGEANQRDFGAYSSLSKVVDQTILTIGLSVDQQALAKRFDEAKLSPAPEGMTQAEADARAATKPTTGE